MVRRKDRAQEETLRAPEDQRPKARRKLPDASWLIFAIVVFEVSAFGLLALRDGAVDPVALMLAVALPAILAVQAGVLSHFFPYMDKYLFVMAHFLCGLGVAVLYRLGADKGIKHLLAYALGCAAQVVAIVSMAKYKNWWKLRFPIMGVSLILLLAALLLGKEKFGANNWISFGGFSMQPSEFVKVAVPVILALYLAKSKKLHEMLPAGAFVIACVLLLVLQKDLGAVLIYFAAAILMYYVATSDLIVTILGLVGAAGGAVLSYKLFAHVRVRVAIWRNPWATVDSSGYQIVQSLMAIGSGGLFGMGLDQGLPRSIPVYDSDFIFAVICEEFGVVMGLCVIALYVLIILRGMMLAMRARDKFASLLAFGVTAVFAVQTFLIVGGVINMIPLTGVTLPFISSGGSSMLSCLSMVGILAGLSATQAEAEAEAWRAARGKMRVLEERP